MLTDQDKLNQAYLAGYVEGTMDGYQDGWSQAERYLRFRGAERREYGVWALIALCLAAGVGLLMKALGVW